MSHKSSFLKRTTRLAIYLRDSFRCVYCGETVSPEWLSIGVDGETATIDHVDGRSNNWSNLVTACKPCNDVKKNFGLEFFCVRRGLDFEIVRASVLRAGHRRDARVRRVAREILHNLDLVERARCPGCETVCASCLQACILHEAMKRGRMGCRLSLEPGGDSIEGKEEACLADVSGSTSTTFAP